MARKPNGRLSPATLDGMLLAAEAQHPMPTQYDDPNPSDLWTMAGMRLECLKLAKDMHTDRSVESVAARAEKMYNYIVSGTVPEA